MVEGQVTDRSCWIDPQTTPMFVSLECTRVPSLTRTLGKIGTRS